MTEYVFRTVFDRLMSEDSRVRDCILHTSCAVAQVMARLWAACRTLVAVYSGFMWLFGSKLDVRCTQRGGAAPLQAHVSVRRVCKNHDVPEQSVYIPRKGERDHIAAAATVRSPFRGGMQLTAGAFCRAWLR